MTNEQNDGRLAGFHEVDSDSSPDVMIDYLRQMQRVLWMQPPKLDALDRLDLDDGQVVLDVGSGLGADTRMIGWLVPDGLAVGVDNSEKMLSVARKDTPRELADRVVFFRGNAQELILPDGSVDGFRQERTWQHVPNPAAAISEAVRVTKPGRPVVAIDTNWGALEWRGGRPEDGTWFEGLYQSEITNPTLAAELAGRFRGRGLRGVRETRYAFETTNFDEADFVLRPRRTLQRSIDRGIIRPDEEQRADRWLQDLQGSGRFAARLQLHVVSGIKPARALP